MLIFGTANPHHQVQMEPFLKEQFSPKADSCHLSHKYIPILVFVLLWEAVLSSRRKLPQICEY